MNHISIGKPVGGNRQSRPNGLITPQRQKISVQELLDLGNKFHKEDQIDKAETVFRRILEVHPDHPAALHFLGVIAQQSGHLESAIRLIEKAVKIAPDYHTAHNNLGNAYRNSGDYKKAENSYNRAIELNPEYGEAYFNQALMLIELREFEEAIESLEASVKFNPRHLDTHLELGELFHEQGEKYKAQIAYKMVLHLDDRNTLARCKLAHILDSLGKYDEAIAEFKKVLEFDPKNTSALNGLGRILNKGGEFKKSLKYLQQSMAIDDNNTEALSNLASTYQGIGDIVQAAKHHARVLAIAPGAVFAEKSFLFVSLNNPNYSIEQLYDLHIGLRGVHDKPEFTNKSFDSRSRDPKKRLKIGYLSSDFRTHVVALNMLPLIMGHRHDEFEIFLYYHSKNDDLITKTFSDNADHFRFVNTMNDQELANQIEEDEIDIFVTLAGRFDENRPLVSTYRPAPIQVSFHDCATSGLEAMDYYFTDSVIHPKTTEDKFTEELYRLPTYYQYPSQEGLPEINELPVLKNGFLTFCSFNKPEKINDEVVKLWAEVLKAIPDSRLLMKFFKHYSEPLMQERTLERFGKNGIGEDRLILNASQDSRGEHLTLYHQADIALDPFPFNGATTTFEALSMGVPVITLQGDHFVSRVATSMVTHVGYPEFAAHSKEQYVNIAKTLFGDLDGLSETRQLLRDKLHSSSLCDGEVYTTNVEAAYRDMWQTWCTTGGYKGK